jgi:hypothetical protein
MTEPQQEKPRWPGFKYEPVRGLMGRHISRYLRIQRKNMRRFFTERGIFDLAERLNVIRKDSAMGMLEKNRKFQEILNEYSQRTAPQSDAKADDLEATGNEDVDLPTETWAVGAGSDAGESVSEVANTDSGFVIEE